MASLTTTYWQIFLAQGICEGIGMGIMYMPAVTGRHLSNASVAFQLYSSESQDIPEGLFLKCTKQCWVEDRYADWILTSGGNLLRSQTNNG